MNTDVMILTRVVTRATNSYPSRTNFSILRRDIFDQSSGLTIDPDHCSAAQTAIAKQTIQNVKKYTWAARDALHDADRSLFHFFFKDADWPVVNTAFQNMYNVLNGFGFTVGLWCLVPENTPACTNSLAMILLYGVDEAEIFLCPEFYNSAPLPDPCNLTSLNLTPGLGFTQTYALMHEVLHIQHLAGNAIHHTQDRVGDPGGCHLYRNYQPTLNTDSYAFFAQWAWIQQQQDQSAQCPEVWPLWNITSTEFVLDTQHDELRHLLAATDGAVTDDEHDVLDCTTQTDECTAFDESKNRTATVGGDEELG